MPPVSSRTTSRSTPSISSRLSGLESSSAGLGRTGRRLANRPRPLRRPSSPCSGRGLSGSVVSHFGPPTAQSSTASDCLHASRTSSVRAVPCSSIDAPPIRCSVISKSPSLARTVLAATPISGPIPSPGRRTMLGTAGVDVEPDVVEDERIRGELEHRLGERLPDFLREPGQVRAHRHGRGEVVWIRRLDGLVLQPAAHLLEPGGAQALLGLLWLGEVPHHLHAFE